MKDVRKIEEENILSVLKSNFIPFAGELLSNNLPSVCDGLLPVHRKVIYALYENGMVHTKPFKKMLICSAEVMKYYVFGDLPLTSAMKNMGSNALSYKYIDPKGSYPDKNRKDGIGSSPRYIESRTTEYSEYLLDGIEKKSVPFVPNWDESTEEPVYLPSPLPNMLVNNSQSIAVGFASKTPSFNLIEVCDSFIHYLKTKDINGAMELIKGIDSPLGANMIYDSDELRKILTTGRGSFQMVATWKYDQKQNMIVVTEIPFDTYIEDIDEKIRLNMEKGKLKEISEVHDGSDRNGVRYLIHLKKNADVDTVIAKLRKYTPFQSSVSVNMYFLRKDGLTPHLYSLKEIIEEWTEHRVECIKKELAYDINTFKDKQHRLEGLIKVSTDLDAAIEIIRKSKNEKEASSKLVEKFELTKIQLDYITTIKWMNLNMEWIQKQTKEYQTLTKKINEAEKTIVNDNKIKQIIIKQLENGKEKFGFARKTKILYDVEKTINVDIVDDFECTVVCTQQGYVKKNIRYNENQKVKDGDKIMSVSQTTNKSNLLIFTNMANMYTVKIYSLDETAPSSLGQYLPALLNLEADEEIIFVVTTTDYIGNLIFCYENGKVARVPFSSYKTTTKKISKAYNQKEKLIGMFEENSNQYIMLDSQNKKRLIYDIKTIGVKASRSTSGIQVMKLKKNDVVEKYINLKSISDDMSYYLLKQAGVGKYIKKEDII